jgi:two-component system sensor histidine kinase KdpD
MKDLMENCKRTPEDFLELIDNQRRAKLKVYLGSAAGVGKTFAMLSEGHRLKECGIDVVIGYLEPHERVETIARAKGLEEVSVHPVTHGKLKLREMDLAAVLRRHPTVALVDELAHTNAPGSKHEKRYQDVAELLDAGINVITTLNIQHLESLYNIVEDATGIKVKERIPDEVLAQADQVIDVDLEAEDLIERLRAGKIYRPDRIDAALSNFFSPKNLTKLREIMLSETANLLSKRQRESGGGVAKPAALNKVMVRIRGGEQDAEALLRGAARLANQLNAQWFAVHVVTVEEESRRLSGDHQNLSRTMDLAKTMGAETVMVKDEDVPGSLVQFAKANGITHIVQGHPTPKRWWKRFKKNYTEILLERLPDVHLIML